MTAKIYLILFLIAFSCNSNGNYSNAKLVSDFRYWEDLSDSQKEEIVTSSYVFKGAVDFYKGNYSLTDNNKTIELLDSLTLVRKNEKVNMLYFFLFNKILDKADGSLSETLTTYCIRVIINSPNYVFYYLSKNERVLKKYALSLGYEFYFKEKGTSTFEYNYNDFKRIIDEKIIEKDKYEKVLKVFYIEIENAMKKMD